SSSSRSSSSSPEAEASLDEIRRLRAAEDEVVVIVDDDPTGTQTLSDIDVVARWDEPTLEAAMRARTELFVLANTRAFPEAAAVPIAAEGAANARAVARSLGRRLVLMSRSDSTLRGHFPAEVDALDRGAQVVLCPAFLELGRVTIDGVHYVEQD